MSDINPNCDGAHCVEGAGEVRVYPLGAGGNLILCRRCWVHENRFRYNRRHDLRNASDWPCENWETARRYPE